MGNGKQAYFVFCCLARAETARLKDRKLLQQDLLPTVAQCGAVQVGGPVPKEAALLRPNSSPKLGTRSCPDAKSLATAEQACELTLHFQQQGHRRHCFP